MKVIKGLVLFGFLVAGIFSSSSEVQAAIYDESKINFTPDSVSNRDALEYLEDIGELENCPIPLDKIATDDSVNLFQPMMLRATPKIYTFSMYKTHNGIRQYLLDDLCPSPAIFTWDDNGIPEGVLKSLPSIGPKVLSFIPGSVNDTGRYGWNSGWYFRLFNTPWGNFWASAWNYNHLVYG